MIHHLILRPRVILLVLRVVGRVLHLLWWIRLRILGVLRGRWWPPKVHLVEAGLHRVMWWLLLLSPVSSHEVGLLWHEHAWGRRDQVVWVSRWWVRLRMVIV